MKSIGLDQICDHLTVSPNILIREVKQRLMNQFIQDWKTRLQSTMGKLRAYKEIKHDFNYELHLEFPYYLRNTFTKLRINNHSLRIETGRFSLPSLPIEDHKCFLCRDSVEDQLHFLFDCGHYHDLEEHKVMLSYCEYINNSFKDLSNIDKWNFISNINDLHARYLLCRFVVKGLQTRTILLS